jgi:hypothetical protein
LAPAGGIDSILREDPLDRVPTNRVSEIGKGALDDDQWIVRDQV